ncbi:hypothetical protein [Streptomyces yangpuensis]|uniref:hypothetical protein n=1 Tax=Streptomyces yangpuensis TaxID=1648182 RepID=UPI00364A33E7
MFTPLPLIQRGLAFHEAGHTVLGQLVGFTCERVLIHPITRDGVTGWTGATTWARSFGSYLDVAVVCGASGQPPSATPAVSPRRRPPLHGRPRQADGAEHPHRRGRPGHRDRPGDGGLAWDHVMATAQQRVDREWDRITAVAEALLAAPDFTLTGTQAAQIAGITTA